MPLDPQVEKIVYWALRARTGTYAEIGVARAREHYAKAVTTLDVLPRPMDRVVDLQIALAGRTLRARHYVPVEHSWADPQPALLFFHGGGFTIGSIDTHDRLCRVLAEGARCHVVSVDYRLAPEHRFPSAADDAFESLLWLREQAQGLGIDRERLAVGGDSAGGTLAAATALLARDQGHALRLQLLIYPGMSPDQKTASHERLRSGYLLDAEVVQWFFGNYIRTEEDRRDWRFAPLLHPDLTGVAPVWMALAEYDPLLDEGLAYAERLREAGVSTETIVFPGMIHAFFQHGGLVKTARGAHAQACAALARALQS